MRVSIGRSDRRASPRPFSQILSHKMIAMRASLAPTLSFSRTGEVWEFGTCACLHTPCSWFAQARGKSLWCLEEEPARERKRDRVERDVKTRQGREDDRTYAVRDRHKAVNPWEYRACASGQLARGLHELRGGIFGSLPARPRPLFLLSISGYASLHARHSADPEYFFLTTCPY